MEPLADDAKRWVDETLGELSLRERIGQLIVPMLTADSAAPATVPQWVAETGIGGGHVFGGPLEKCLRATGEADEAARVPLLFSGDFDMGAGERVGGTTTFPPLMAVGAADDERLAEAFGKAIAVEGRAAGYNWAFAPIVDLAALKDYQRQVTSFGRDPEAVGRLAAAFIRGMQDHGMAACAKHFPGDGFDDRDQHLMTLVNPLSPEVWRRQSAVPFRSAIDAGVWTIMVSCIGLPSMDPDAGDPQNPRPALVSRPLVTDLLRKELGFRGVIVSDALNMGGVSYHHRRLDRYRLALQAGIDILLFVREVARAIDYLEGCVERGELDAAEIEASCRRVLTLKARLGLHRDSAPPTPEQSRSVLEQSSFQSDADRLAERSITLLRDSAGTVPVRLRAGLRVATVAITNSEKFTLDAFNAVLREAGCEVTAIRDPQTDKVHDLVAEGRFDVVVTGFYFPSQFGWNTTRIHGPYSRCVMSGYPIAHPDTRPVWISFSNPHHLYELPFMDPYLVTYSGSPASQRAAARALLGQIPIRGHIPAELDGFYRLGDGIHRPAAG